MLTRAWFVLLLMQITPLTVAHAAVINLTVQTGGSGLQATFFQDQIQQSGPVVMVEDTFFQFQTTGFDVILDYFDGDGLINFTATDGLVFSAVLKGSDSMGPKTVPLTYSFGNSISVPLHGKFEWEESTGKLVVSDPGGTFDRDTESNPPARIQVHFTGALDGFSATQLVLQGTWNNVDANNEFFRISAVTGGAAVPEPSSAVIAAMAILGFVLIRKRKTVRIES